MATRREFTNRLIGVAASAALGERPVRAAAAVPATGGVRATPAGELAERIRLTADRLTRGQTPAFTREFVVADVALDRRRRFTEFSGDLSGRTLEALAALPAGSETDLEALVREVLGHQRADGRFGDATLRYSAEAIDTRHMALLWGNGRLLLGLLQCHARSRSPEVLAAARRLGDFLVGVRRQCAEPAVARRLQGQGAFGIICFTQLVEPLVLLAEATGDRGYLAVAREIVPLLGPRGVQHAHGYLTTLRGAVALSQASGDPSLLSAVETRYRDLVDSTDLALLGGVMEYFGWEDPRVTGEERKALVTASGRDPRDEGCGVADFLRLSLQLWRATGNLDYLDRAERCLLNHFFFNQFSTGDFGHHVFSPYGTKPTESVGRAWWCCTMHGYRAFADVLDALVTVEDGVVRVNLAQDADWSGQGFRLSIRQRWTSAFRSGLTVEVREAPAQEAAIAVRRPAGTRVASANVEAGAVLSDNPYVTVRRRFRRGDRIVLDLEHELRLTTRDRRVLEPEPLRGETEAALFVGPRLYAADDGLDPLFFGEPWTGENLLSLPVGPATSTPAAAPARPPAGPLSVPASHLATRYRHGGFAGEETVTLRPIAEQAGRLPGATAFWLRWRPGA